MTDLSNPVDSSLFVKFLRLTFFKLKRHMIKAMLPNNLRDKPLRLG